MSAHLNVPTHVLMPERPDLYKLDMFGKKCPDEDLDFQFPTEAELRRIMQANNEVQLNSISTKHDDQLYGI